MEYKSLLKEVIKEMQEEENKRIKILIEGINKGCNKCSQWDDYWGCDKCR